MSGVKDAQEVAAEDDPAVIPERHRPGLRARHQDAHLRETEQGQGYG